MLDEPANGLDPEGIAWLRDFLKAYAAKGNAVFVSSHLLGEMSQLADNGIGGDRPRARYWPIATMSDLLSQERRIGRVRPDKDHEAARTSCYAVANYSQS